MIEAKAIQPPGMAPGVKEPQMIPRAAEGLISPLEEADSSGWRAEMLAAGLCGGLGIAGAVLSHQGPVKWSVAAYAFSYLAGSWFSVREMWGLLRTGKLDVHFLMLLVAAGSASIGGWAEGAVLLFLFSFSGAMEQYAMGRTEREIRSLFKASPKAACGLRETAGGLVEEMVPVGEITPGLRLRLKPGDLVPVDCELASGRTACDESALTGEAIPVEKQPGEELFAGTLNLWGAVEVVVLRPAAQSALSRIIEIIREAQHLKAPAQQFTDRFSSWYTYTILSLSLAMYFVWWLGFGLAPFKMADGPSAFYRTMTLLVVASPCALVLSIPSAILAAIAHGARRGILFRGGSAVERLAQTTIVAMDKTGTITTGDLRIEKIESFPPGREAEVASLAVAMEALSTHPLARAVAGYGRQNQIAPAAITDFESLPGLGLRANAAGLPARLGKRGWVMEDAPGAAEKLVENSPAQAGGFSEIWVRCGELAGRITLRDEIRPEAARLVAELHRLKMRTILLTGDRAESGERARAKSGIQEVKAGLKPEEKLRVIGGLKRQGERVAMIGDGINDAPSLAAADVGVAMGARGSDAALEQADVVLMHDKLENFLTALQLSQRARRIIQQNLFISLGTVSVLVLFAVQGSIPLTVGVVGHEGSTVLVVLNSLRLLRNRRNFPDR